MIMEPVQKMFLLLADIKGYTPSMLSDDTAYKHAQVTLTTLTETLAEKVESPLKTLKHEGDTLFIYLMDPPENRMWLTEKIFAFFDAFERKANELMISNVCDCGACKNIGSLQFRVLCHYGDAGFQSVGHFKDLRGKDVTLLKSLLDNHVVSPRYLLLTDAAYQKMLLPDTVKVAKMQESNAEFGTFPIYVCEPPRIPESELPKTCGRLEKFKHWLKLSFAPKLEPPFRNLPEKIKQR